VRNFPPPRRGRRSEESLEHVAAAREIPVGAGAQNERHKKSAKHNALSVLEISQNCEIAIS
jgi:hypothetical protein